MSRHGLEELSSILAEAVELFNGYEEPDPPTTWGTVLQRHDPTNKLRALESRIMKLKKYGLSQ